MILPFKLSDTGIVWGSSQYITVKANPDTPNTGKVVNKGYDFAILTEPTIKVANLELMRSDYSQSPQVARIAINIPCSKRLLTNNTEQGVPVNWTWQNEETGKMSRWVPFQNYSKAILDHGHEHIYMAKHRETEETVFLVTGSGLQNIPEEVRSKLKAMSFLVRFTIKWPRVYNNQRYNAWISNPSGRRMILTQGSTTYVAEPSRMLFAYCNWPMRTIITKDNSDVRYESSFCLSKWSSSYPTYDDNGFPISDSNSVIKSDIRTYIDYDSSRPNPNTDISETFQYQDSRLESTIFLEGGNRDIAWTPIILNQDGGLELVTMDNNLNSTATSTRKFLSTVLSSNPTVDPETPTPQPMNLDNLYVKI